MKKNKTFIILALLLVILIGGAGILYNKLSSSYKQESLSAAPSQKKETEETEEKEAESETETEENQAAPSEQSEEPQTAPDFTMTDASGKEVKLSDFFGKPIVLNFWASWCGPCKSEMPHFEEAYQKYGEDIHFLIVNLTDGARETTEGSASFIEENGYTFPVYYDTKTEGAMTYGTYSIPVTYFIAADGSPVAQGSGALDYATLEKGIQMIQ